jgi:spermidine synthase
MPGRRTLLFVLFTISGFAGLIYESLWTHYLKLFLGHAAYAQTLVLGLFMGGMAIGAWLASKWSGRWRNLLRAYAIVEVLVGVAAIAFHDTFIAATEIAYTSWLPAAGSEAFAFAIKWALAAALILPQSMLLGMTFPLMSAGLLRRHPERPGAAISLLYFTNSLGAAVGVLASGFVLIDRLGLPGAMQFAGFLNIALAIVVWCIAPGPDGTRPAAATKTVAGDHQVLILLGVALLTGAASFIYEIAWIRMLSLVLGASTHSFELMLSAFILGLALGGLWIRWGIDSLAKPLVFLAGVQIAMGLLALGSLPLYDAMFDLMQSIVRALAKTEGGYGLYLAASHAIALAIMLPATFCAGMTLPLITYTLLRDGHGEQTIGRVYAANTLGAIVGVAFAAQIGMPLLGVKGLVIAGAGLDVALGIALLLSAGANWRYVTTACAMVVFGVIALGSSLDPYKLASGVFRRGDLFTKEDSNLIFYRDGKTTSVALLKIGDDLSLRTNGKSDGAINMNEAGPRVSDEMTMVLTAAIPFAHRPAATEVAIIGIGTGLTTHAMVAVETVQRVETIEIEPFMAAAARHFAPRNSNSFGDPKSHIVFDDAKTHFSTANRRYDIIISEPSNPWVSGVSSLFTREFYRHVKRYLKPEGVLTQWFQMYEITPELVASVLRAIGEEFEDYAIYAANDGDLLIVAGSSNTFAKPLYDVFQSPALTAELRRVHVRTIGDIELRRIGGKKIMAPFFATYGVPANSDFHPYLDLHAARHRFMQSSARDLTQFGQDGVPVIAILEGVRPERRPISYAGDDYLKAIELARRGAHAHEFLAGAGYPEPRGIPAQLQKDLELLRLRGLDCLDSERSDIWRQSAYQVARLVNSSLTSTAATAIWQRIEQSPCMKRLEHEDRDWFSLYSAIGRRDTTAMAAIGKRLLKSPDPLKSGQVQYLLTAALTGAIAQNEWDQAVDLWNKYAQTAAGTSIDMNLRVLYGQIAAAGRSSAVAPLK